MFTCGWAYKCEGGCLQSEVYGGSFFWHFSHIVQYPLYCWILSWIEHYTMPCISEPQAFHKRATFKWPWNESAPTKNIKLFDCLSKGYKWVWLFGWWCKRLPMGEKFDAQLLSRNYLILSFDVILRHDWPIEHCLLRLRVFLEKENKEIMCWSFHWLAYKRNSEH